MGRDPNEERNHSRSTWRRRSTTGVADWKVVPGDVLINAICAAGMAGGALRFGYSKDGGAYALGVYGDGEPYTEFIAPADDPAQVLLDITEFFQEQRDKKATTGQPSDPAKGKKKG